MAGLTRIEESTSMVAYSHGLWVGFGGWQAPQFLSKSYSLELFKWPQDMAADFLQSKQFKQAKGKLQSILWPNLQNTPEALL